MAEYKLRIQWRAPEELTPYVQNPKAHPGEQVDKIAASLAEYKFDQPIVIDGQGVIIKGHGRRQAALQLGLKKVPVVVRDDLTEAQIKAARLADNRLAESAWIDDALESELTILKDLDFDLSLTGFDEVELLAYLQDDDLRPQEEPEFEEFDESVEDEVPLAVCPNCGERFVP